jgi:hypothetical protein
MDDQEFAVGHGYRCVLPDVTLIVERSPLSWDAIVFPSNEKKPAFHQSFDSSGLAKRECVTFVNSWRGAERQPKHAPLEMDVGMGAVLVASDKQANAGVRRTWILCDKL